MRRLLVKKALPESLSKQIEQHKLHHSANSEI
jgi:hypothetical protein